MGWVGYADALAEELAQHSGRHAQAKPASKEPLSSVMTLIPKYFPEELYSSKDKRCASPQHGTYQISHLRFSGGKSIWCCCMPSVYAVINNCTTWCCHWGGP